jgi:hypothetical protein
MAKLLVQPGNSQYIRSSTGPIVGSVGTGKSGEVEMLVGVRCWLFPSPWRSRGSDCQLPSRGKSICSEIVSATIPYSGTLSKSSRGS